MIDWRATKMDYNELVDIVFRKNINFSILDNFCDKIEKYPENVQKELLITTLELTIYDSIYWENKFLIKSFEELMSKKSIMKICKLVPLDIFLNFMWRSFPNFCEKDYLFRSAGLPESVVLTYLSINPPNIESESVQSMFKNSKYVSLTILLCCANAKNYQEFKNKYSKYLNVFINDNYKTDYQFYNNIILLNKNLDRNISFIIKYFNKNNALFEISELTHDWDSNYNTTKSKEALYKSIEKYYPELLPTLENNLKFFHGNIQNKKRHF